MAGETIALSRGAVAARRPLLGTVLQVLASTPVILGAILALGAALRLLGLNWDQGHHLHPDERFITILETRIHWPNSLAQYLDFESSPLNPYRLPDVSFFVYGTFPVFLVKAVASLFESVAKVFGSPADFTSYDRINLVGRGVSAVFDLGTAAMVFLIGRRLFDRRAGLLAALLYVLTVLSIQISHFFAVDTFSTFFATAAIYLAIRSFAGGRWYHFLALGIALGFALASKLSTGLTLPFLVAYAAWVALEDRRRGATFGPPMGVRTFLSYRSWPRWAKLAGALALAFAVAALAFRIAQPYAFRGSSILDFRPAQQFLDAVKQQRAIQEGSYDWPPGIQWAVTTPFLFPLQNMVLWGLGPALGVTSIAALLFGFYRSLIRADRSLVVLVAWVGLNFFYFGGLVLKTMRYLHPIYPILCILAAWLLLFLWDRRRAIRIPGLGVIHRDALPAALLAFTVGGTAFWALAFHQIYSRPVTRAAASQWIYENIPPGSTIADEHWDDSLPLHLPRRDAGVFNRVTLGLYEDETFEKREKLIGDLASADYVILSSNRLSDSIPRMPQRYPMTSRYYAALFAGELGFDEVAVFTSHPSLLGISVIDDSAEEAFTVYDHPKVRVFRKSARYDPVAVRALLESIDITAATRILPRNATSLTLMLSEADRELVRATGTFKEIYPSATLAARIPALAWFGFVMIAGLAAWPLVRLALGRLPDSGYLAAKPVGLLLAVYPVWLLASARWARFDRPAIAVSVLLTLVAAAALAFITRRSLRRDLAEKWPVILAGEALFAAAFVFLLAVRVRNPDLWHTAFGGEKPMDFAHLNAVIRSDFFPPYDPWWAGGYINYYYFGQLFTATPAKLLGIPPAVAYNLGLPTMFAFAVVAVFSFGFNFWRAFGGRLAAAAAVGLLSILFVLVVGNLDSAVQLVQSSARHVNGAKSIMAVIFNVPRTLLGGDLVKEFDFWRSTRVLEQTVNEFPYFTFLYGDLHPHLINLAWTLLALIGSLAMVLVRPAAGLFEPGLRAGRRMRLVLKSGYLPPLLALAVALAIHRVVNPWDFPTYLVIAVLASSYAYWRAAGRITAPVVAGAGLTGAALVALSYAIFFPFHRSFGVFFGGIVATPQTSALSAYLAMFGGVFLIVLVFALVTLAPKDLGNRPYSVFLAIAFLAAVVFLVFVGDRPASARLFQIAAVGLTALGAFNARRRPVVFLPMAFVLGGLLLTAVSEWVALEGDIGRLNTVFKTYFQAWVLFGLAAAILLPQVLPELRRKLTGRIAPFRHVLTFAIFAAIFGTALYPVAATQAKLGLRMFKTGPTLDGLAYMDGAVIEDQGRKIELRYDKEALDWLLRNVEGRPAVLEATVNVYRWGSRVSVITGLPTVVGWDWHEKQQRWAYVHQIDTRRRDVETAFGTTSPRQLFEILDRYGVDLIYVGALERAYYSAAGIAKFDALVGDRLTLLYQNPATKIYGVQR